MNYLPVRGIIRDHLENQPISAISFEPRPINTERYRFNPFPVSIAGPISGEMKLLYAQDNLQPSIPPNYTGDVVFYNRFNPFEEPKVINPMRNVVDNLILPNSVITLPFVNDYVNVNISGNDADVKRIVSALDIVFSKLKKELKL